MFSLGLTVSTLSRYLKSICGNVAASYYLASEEICKKRVFLNMFLIKPKILRCNVEQ